MKFLIEHYLDFKPQCELDIPLYLKVIVSLLNVEFLERLHIFSANNEVCIVEMLAFIDTSI